VLGDLQKAGALFGLLMSRARLMLVGLLVFLAALAVMAVSAAACGSGGGKESTTLTTKLSGESKEGTEITVLEGAKVKDKATLSGKNVSKATGKVKYDVYSDNKCEHLVTAAGEGTVSGESVTGSEEKELEAGKTYYWQATYEGNESNSGSTSSCGSEVLNVKAKTTLSTKLSGESKEAEELTVLEGSKAKDKATLSGTNSSTATGKALYKIYSDKECKTLVKEAGEVTLESGAKIPASTEEELEAGKTYYWQATYKGDGLHQESTSTCGSEVLNVKAKVTLTTILSGEDQESETVEAQPISAITDDAKLKGTNVSSATGTVSYDVYTDKECTKLVAEAGSVSVSSGAAPASTEEVLATGTYYWQASYGGDALHQSAKSTCGTEVLTVKPGTTLTTTLSGEGQEDSQIEVGTGQEVTDHATLSGESASMATGTVKYAVYSDSECTKLVETAGEVVVTAGSVPSSLEKKLAAGTYYWQATYSGDSSNLKSTSECGSEITVVRETGWLTTSFSGESVPSIESDIPEPFEVTEETAIVDTATLHGEEPGTATGKVTYSIYSDPECKELVTTAGEVTVTKGVIPNSSEKKLSKGLYYWQASYSGDEHHHSLTSPCGSEVSVVTASTSLSTSLSAEGQSGKTVTVSEATNVKDEATLSGSGASTASGTINYDVYSNSECTTLATEAGAGTVTSGVAPASSLVHLPAGTYYWQASYSGDGSNAPSKSSCGSEVMTVKKTTRLSTELSSATQKGGTVAATPETAITDHATLSEPGSSSASGTVTYKIYSDSKCETLVKEAGTVTVKEGVVPASSEEKLSAGTYYWQASYSGDSEHASSVSECGSEISVVASTAVITALTGEEETQESLEVLEGAAVTDKATLESAHSSTASGTVTYKVYSDSKCETLVKEAGTVTVKEGVVPASSEEKLSAGTYYWQASYSGDAKNTAGISVCGVEKLVVKPEPKPTLEQVGFKNKNIPVIVDHPVTNVGGVEAESKIEDWPVVGEGTVEWKNKTGTGGKKNWPVAYVRGRKIEVETKFAPDALTKKFVENGKLEEAKFRGTMKVFGQNLEVEPVEYTNKTLKKQLAEPGGLITTGARKTTATLPNKDGYENVTITWEWEYKLKGVVYLWRELERSEHNFYVLFDVPKYPPNYEQKMGLYLTVLDIASKGSNTGAARAPVEGEKETQEGVWKGFTNLSGGAGSPPKTVVRNYEPARGKIEEGNEISYWPAGVASPVGKTLAATDAAAKAGWVGGRPVHYFAKFDIRIDRNGLPEVVNGSLFEEFGECNTWAELLEGAMNYEGFAATTVFIYPVLPPVRSPMLLVKNWNFTKPNPGEQNPMNEVIRAAGEVGQGQKNPYAYFRNHRITLVEPRGQDELYDPSYAPGPPITYDRGAVNEVPNDELLKYQEGSFVGSCSDSVALPPIYRCEKPLAKMRIVTHQTPPPP
jgi:hypothetical protein